METLNAIETSGSLTKKGRIAVSTLNQWALDFEGNKDRIIESIRQARADGAKYRLGPELEIPGYSCEDHFYENDTTNHSHEMLAEILASGVTDGILSVIGTLIMHNGVRYNCDAYVLNGKIVGFRPKQNLADDGNYREPRWFTAWTKTRQVEDFVLPPVLQRVTGQRTVPVGDFLIETNDTVLGSEKCEEMFTARNPGIEMALSGAELLGNGSGSHWELRKLGRRLDLIKNATAKAGGVYAYSNLEGGDGGRLFFDGSSMIAQNGKILAQGPQFSLKEVETTCANIDFASVESFRGATRSLGIQADQTKDFPRIKIDFAITTDDLSMAPSQPMEARLLTPEEEIAKGPALWLWDYLRRSGGMGFFLPLSGGVDSSATASIVGSMCNMIVEEALKGNQQVIKDVRKILGEDENSEYTPTNPKELAGRIFFTCYEASDGVSSQETEKRAKDLSAEIGATHLRANISKIIEAFREEAKNVLNIDAKFENEDGSRTEDLALQNIQARSRMALSYLLAQLIPVSEMQKGKRKKEGFVLVLGSANVDEANRGYFTKYDCSSADINPIGGINKSDLKSFLRYAAETFGYKTLLDALAAAPTAELQPMKEGQEPQTDEKDMGMTYDELREFATLRKIQRMGPVSMFEHLVHTWGPKSEKKLPVREVAVKVIRFFRNYALNRHKLTTLTPSVHAESYSPDDNRFDLRPFLMNAAWTLQFARIAMLTKKYSEALEK